MQGYDSVYQQVQYVLPGTQYTFPDVQYVPLEENRLQEKWNLWARDEPHPTSLAKAAAQFLAKMLD
jgi:hypothetical protein